MKKTQIGLFLLLLLLPFLCETTGTGFTPGRLLMLVRGSCWVLGPALGRSCGVGGGSAAWGCPSVSDCWWGSHRWPGRWDSVGDQQRDSCGWPVVGLPQVTSSDSALRVPKGSRHRHCGQGEDRLQTWLGISGQSRHCTESKEFL